MPYDIQTLLVNDMTIDEELKTLNELLKEKNAELNNHKKKRDNYQEQARTQQMKRDNYKELSRKHMSKINELDPIRKSGKERHNLYDRFDDEDDELMDYRPRESARDYYDDGDEE